ncbi:MAG: hypothetical protein M0Z58_02975 [Nitrospiraceae bacterium]|nr:hypothetical protein [Nitrospiraceae bacterium]
MGPLIKDILSANDRLYDLAVAVYAASGFLALAGTRWAGARGPHADESGGRPREKNAGNMGPGKGGGKAIPAKLARFSLILFVLLGVPRLLCFHGFEWRAAVDHGSAGTLLVKISVLFSLAALGTLAWVRAGKGSADS